MAVPLGPRIRSPVFLVLNIFLCMSIFYVSLSASYSILRSAAFLASVVRVPRKLLLPDETVFSFFDFRVSDLFAGNKYEFTFFSFFFMHLIAAVFTIRYMGKVLQRSKDAADYVPTVYFIYYIISVVASRSFLLGGVLYFLALIICSAFTTWRLLRKTEESELAEIRLNPV